MANLAGKTALVAGASRGIGLAIAKAVAAEGAQTILAARSLPALEDEAAKLRQAGFAAEALCLDITNPLSTPLPAVDILINVAGTNLRKRFEDYTEQEYHSLLQTNLHGIVQLTQKIGAGMIERGRGGKIVMIGSLTSVYGLPYITIYALTKSAMAGLTRSLAVEWGRYNIQVNCIAPGFIPTDLNRAMWQSEEMRRWLVGAQANPRLGTPEDVAPLAAFLSGPGSDYITGQVISVDGGHATTGNWPFLPA